MGRGRAKAKQTKVARELKYHSPETDYEALQRELSGNGRKDDNVNVEVNVDVDDPYADYYGADAEVGEPDEAPR